MRTELVTTLKRQATELLAELQRDREPILITQHGVPSAYLLDVDSLERLQQRMAVLEGIARGEMAVAEGRVVSHADAKARMRRWRTGSDSSCDAIRAVAQTRTPDWPRS